MRTELLSAEDISTFASKSQQLDLYQFDKVVNDVYAETGGTSKLFNKIIRPKLS